MSQPPADQDIERLLQDLQNPKAIYREHAVNALAQLGSQDERVIRALENLAANDPVRFVSDAAHSALSSLGVTPPVRSAPFAASKSIGKVYATRNTKILDFLIGFIAWFAVNGALWFLLAHGQSIVSSLIGTIITGPIVANLFILPANLLILIVLAFLRRWMAFGILVAVAINLAIALVLGMGTNATCAIPFFIK
jgi:hypothetical protein